MNQYLLAVHGVDGQHRPSQEVMMKIFADVDTFNKTLREKGAWVFAGGLHPPSSATVVRPQEGGDFLLTDVISPGEWQRKSRICRVKIVHGDGAWNNSTSNNSPSRITSASGPFNTISI